MKTYNEYIIEKNFNEIYHKKNKWVKLLDTDKRKEIAENLYFLINNSYNKLGGHPSIKDINSIFDNSVYYWEAIDLNETPEADAVIFGKKRFGIKISGIGHDNTKNSKKEIIKKLSNQLKKDGYWIEASDKVEYYLYEHNTPYIEDVEVIKKLFNTDKIKWLNDRGKYEREVDKNKFHIETVFGNPTL